MCPKGPLHIQGQTYQCIPITHTQGITFLTILKVQFQVTAQYWNKNAPSDPKMTLTWSKVPDILIPHMPLGPKFLSFSLYEEPFISYGPSLRKALWVSLKSPRHVRGQKHPLIHSTFNPDTMPKFSSVLLCNKRFWFSLNCEEKGTKWPKMTWHIQGHK